MEKLNLQKKKENLEELFIFKKKNHFIQKIFKKKKKVWMSHEDAVVKLPKKFKTNCLNKRLKIDNY